MSYLCYKFDMGHHMRYFKGVTPCSSMSKGALMLIVFCTAPDQTIARALARELVEKKYAACVNIQMGVESVYEWNGQIEQSSEILLIIKTSEARYAALESWLAEAHPYDTPEIIAVPVTHGLSRYTDWVRSITAQESSC